LVFPKDLLQPGMVVLILDFLFSFKRFKQCSFFTTDVSSTTSLYVDFKSKPVPKIFLPKNPAALASSIASSKYQESMNILHGCRYKKC
jgi:hypothetical protein